MDAVALRKIVVAKQNYRCAGCGTRIDPDYIKRLRYCEYLGRYFCQCCHENAQAVVPGRVLRKWDFSKYYVSNFARDLLSKIAGDPLFNPNDINSGLYKKNKALEVVRLCQAKGFVCEFCGNEKDIIFPFQLNKCQHCEECHACYHRNCFRTGKDCPRCQRLAERRERLARKNMEEQEDEGGGS
ncbi:run domain Beclin-1-interacting and cysteine-rich domain-containing protein-like [Gymnodraco acuticeps]|uniref:Run domain Beclin-1-interacting and cysteine-rich domain-containing protein-like n=1 Tax=Gymnodraco acuticeps TaxID=8218 RepID=A0A6P8W325_GYMAC|nr:run domain Beclin-1-interacting and cysteine-rich domain-containing protein-like [Gymnodraco acuticeps]